MLTAVLGNRIRGTSRAILSSSFQTRADLISVIPTHYFSYSSELLFSAVRNDSGLWIEENTHAEPQRTYFDLRGDHGTVLIGAQRRPDSYFGEASSVGDGVTSLGPGLGWEGSLIAPADSGTSFATPAVAAAMLVARAFWAQNNLQVSHREAIRRLILSAQVEPTFSGRFASAGVPNIEHLLLTSGTFAVDTLGAVGRIEIIESSVRLRHQNQAYTRELGSAGILGFAVTDGEAIAFPAVLEQDGRRRWAQVQVDDIHLRVRIGDQAVEISSLEEFSNYFEKVIIL